MTKTYDEDTDSSVSLNWPEIWELLEIVDATLPSKLPNLKFIHDAAMATLVEINESLRPVPEEQPSYEEPAEPVADDEPVEETADAPRYSK